MNPGSETRILDVGVSGRQQYERAQNFLEEFYTHPECVTAVGMDDLCALQARYPKVSVVQADSRHLPFENKAFDIVFSNAVVEHVGGLAEQQAFVSECVRVGKAVFITTPSRSFPIESHTMIPFVHWFPDAFRNAVYRALGRENEGTLGYLTLLPRAPSPRCFRANVACASSISACSALPPCTSRSRAMTISRPTILSADPGFSLRSERRPSRSGLTLRLEVKGANATVKKNGAVIIGPKTTADTNPHGHGRVFCCAALRSLGYTASYLTHQSWALVP